MKLYHVTTRSCLQGRRGILAVGLDPMKSTSPVRKSVWGVVRSKVAWAVVHVLSKRRNAGLSLDDVVVIELTISRSAVRRYNRGVWYTKEHVGRLPVSEAMLLQPSQFGKVGA